MSGDIRNCPSDTLKIVYLSAPWKLGQHGPIEKPFGGVIGTYVLINRNLLP